MKYVVTGPRHIVEGLVTGVSVEAGSRLEAITKLHLTVWTEEELLRVHQVRPTIPPGLAGNGRRVHPGFAAMGRGGS